MKRFTSTLLCILMMLCSLSIIQTNAETVASGTTGSCVWSLDGTTLTISGNGKMASYSTGGYRTNAPWGNEVTHVVIKNGVTNVGQYAFYGCSKLQSVTLPSSVKTIDTQAFDRSGVKTIKFSEGLTKISDGAFNSCTSLHSVVLPESLTYIGDFAFQSCPITNIVFSTSLKYIGTKAFNYVSIVDVWYLGNQSDKAGMTIKGYNACLNTATWHYDSCPIGAPHSYDNECDANCNGCGLLRIVPEHMYDNACDSACNICGKTRNIEHQYDNACDIKCNICQEERVVSHFYDSGNVTQNATCGTTGVKTFICTACGAIKTEDVAKTSDHQYGDWTNADDSKHKHICSVCQKEEFDNHSWNSGTVTKQPTCKEEGEMTYTCRVCLGTKKESVPTIPHLYDNDCDTTCNSCGDSRTVTHNYQTSWEKDKTNHWHECTECGSKKDESKHTPGSAATETSEQKCTVCDYIIQPDLSHVHKYDTGWESKKDGHWHNCSGCEEKKDYAPHKFDNDCDTECSVCGFKRTTTHKFATTYTMDSVHHWVVCSICGEKKDEAVHEAGPEATQDTPQSCTICGYEIVPALGVVESTEGNGSTEPIDENITSDDESTDDSSFFAVIIIVAIAVIGGIATFVVIKKKKR